MFAADSTEDVLLGVPTTSNESIATCYNSKIGGSPLWLAKTPVLKTPPTSCSHCKKEMLFALQIYAPTEVLERALYVYCCPSSCATHSYGWKVLKDQCAKGAAVKSSDKLVKTESPQDKSLKTDWLGLCASPATQSSERILQTLVFWLIFNQFVDIIIILYSFR